MPKADRERLLERLRAVAADPGGSHLSVTPLTGFPGLYRVRQGDWRAVFSIDHRAGRLIVESVGHRREIYR